MIGRLDPKTGDIKLVHTPTPKVNPYGMVLNSKDEPVVCYFRSNKLAKSDPETMEITEYTLPDPAKRPRRIGISSDDVLWYGDYSRGYLGRYKSQNRRSQGMAFPRRTQIDAVWHHRHQRRAVV